MVNNLAYLDGNGSTRTVLVGDEHLFDNTVLFSVGQGLDSYNVGPPSDVCWFIDPMNTIVISTINHSYSSYVHQLSYRLGAPHCRCLLSFWGCAFPWIGFVGKLLTGNHRYFPIFNMTGFSLDNQSIDLFNQGN